MANVRPFKGILYNKKLVEIQKVVTPPYDVITPDEQEYYYSCHPQNIIRLILGKNQPEDSEKSNRYTRAATCYRQWIENNYLKIDDVPAFYMIETIFTVQDIEYSRLGFIAQVGLEKFDTGVIKPHEKTFSKVKSDRFELMKLCHANFSPIFSLYSDPQLKIQNQLIQTIDMTNPDISIKDQKGHTHNLWRVTDTDTHKMISSTMDNNSLFIADGHHRYETALTYLDWVQKESSQLVQKNHPARFIMMYLTAMEDQGLIILPAHRNVSQLDEQVLLSFIEQANQFFTIKTFPFAESNKDSVKSEFYQTLNNQSNKHTIGIYTKKFNEFYCLTTRPNIIDNVLGHIEPSLRQLDVTLITQLILEKIFHFDQTALDNENQITYTTDSNQAIHDVDAGKSAVAILLNATKIDQVKEVAEAGLIMPRKSTYFYPKVMTGLVINQLTHTE